MGALSGFLSGFGGTFSTGIQGAGSAYAKSRHLTKQRQEDRKQLLEDRETKKYEEMTQQIIKIGKNPKDFLGTPEDIYTQMQGALGEFYKNEPDRKRREALLLQANKEGFSGEDAIEKWEASTAKKRTFEEDLMKTQKAKADLEIWNAENPEIAKDYSAAVTAGFSNAYQKIEGGIGWERSDSYSKKGGWEDLKRQITTEKLNKSKARPEDKAALIKHMQTYQRYRNQTLATDDDGNFTVSAQAVSQLDLIGSKIQYAYDKLSDPQGGINFSKQLDVISNAILKYGSLAKDPSIEKGGNVSGSTADNTYGSKDARNNLIDFAFMIPKNNATTDQSTDDKAPTGLGDGVQPTTSGESLGVKQDGVSLLETAPAKRESSTIDTNVTPLFDQNEDRFQDSLETKPILLNERQKNILNMPAISGDPTKIKSFLNNPAKLSQVLKSFPEEERSRFLEDLKQINRIYFRPQISE